jgi:hypothetical protein
MSNRPVQKRPFPDRQPEPATKRPRQVAPPPAPVRPPVPSKQPQPPKPAPKPAPKPLEDDELLDIGNKVRIRKFPIAERINTTKDGKRILIVGGSGMGKSTVALDIVRYNKHIPVWMIVSPTEGRNHTFEPHFPKGCVQDTLSIEALNRFKKRQEKRCEDWQVPGSKDPIRYFRDPSGGIILDDVNVTAQLFKDEIFNWAYFNSRHDKVLWIQLTQYFMSVPISHRRNLSFLFCFRQNSAKEIKKIYDEFAGMFKKFSDFMTAMEICTADYRCMVIDCLNPSTKVQDRIFWYRAPRQQPPFTAGADWFWKTIEAAYDKDWKQRPEPEEPQTGKKGKRKAPEKKTPPKKKAKNDEPLQIELDESENVVE